MEFDEAAARAWCELLSVTLPVRHISPDGVPYLERYYAAGWSPTSRAHTGGIYLHHFVASDPAHEVHSHPWGWSASLILAGSYREHRCTLNGQVDVRDYRPGDVNVLRADDRHRIELLTPDCWTVFLAGSFVSPWRFEPAC